MKAKDYLLQVRRFSTSLEQRKLELLDLLEAATHITQSFNDVKIRYNSNYDKVTDNAVKMADLKNRTQNDMVDLFIRRYEITCKIQQLQNYLHIAILYKHYIEFKDLQTIADELDLTYQYMVEIHGKALKEFEKLHKDFLTEKREGQAENAKTS